MNLSIYLTFVVAVVTHFKGIECFNLGRNVAINDSKTPLTKGDSKDDHLLARQDAQKIFEGPMFRQVVEQNGFSNEILASQIANFLASTQNPQSKAESLAIGSTKPLIENLDDISLEVRAVDRVPVEQVPAGGQLSINVRDFKQSDERDEEDSSNEVRSDINRVRESSFERVHLDATDFHKRPDGGMLIQPESEDWFLVRQYMDDASFRGASKELAKEYFWQPLKGVEPLDSESVEDDSNESS